MNNQPNYYYPNTGNYPNSYGGGYPQTGTYYKADGYYGNPQRVYVDDRYNNYGGGYAYGKGNSNDGCM